MRRRSRFGRRKRPSAWHALCNFQVDAPGTQDRQGFLFQPPLASGTRVGLVATLLFSTGIRFVVGGETGKTRRIVGDAVVSSVIDQGNTVADAYVREAIVWAQTDPSGNVLAQDLDLFSNSVIGGEDILYMRQIYLGAVITAAGVVRPDVYHQWFSNVGYARWDLTVTRRLNDDSLLMYIVCIKKPGLVDPSVVMAGSLRGILVR